MTVIPKRYEYKVFRNGVFLNSLTEEVISPFRYAQQIETAGAELQVEVNVNPDNISQEVDYILDEEGEPILDETGDPLQSERPEDVFGDATANILIQPYNDVEVWMYNPDYPNGKLVFSGYISSYKANYGMRNTVSFTILSYGVELDNHIIEGGTSSDVSQTTQNDSSTVFYEPDFPSWTFVGQTFTPTAENLSAVDLLLQAFGVDGGGVNVTVAVWSAASAAWPHGGGTFEEGMERSLTYVTRFVEATDDPTVQRFTFPTPYAVTPGGSYFIAVYSENSVEVYWHQSNPYAGGQAYDNIYGGGSSGGTWIGGIGPYAADLYFVTYETTGATENPYNSQDPAITVADIMDLYIAQGGNVIYTEGSLELVGYDVSYTFKLNTTLEGIKKMAEMAPATWYWYVDPATNILYFKEVNATADHELVFKKHIGELELAYTVENVKNIVYFSGGDTGSGENLFAKFTNPTSLASYKRGLARISDNRVTLYDSADLLAGDVLDANPAGAYRTTLTIPDGVYDTESFDLGETVSFRGFGNFVDNLILQIVGISRQADSVTLQLGTLRPRSSRTVEALRRELEKVQTVDNPSTPS